MIQAARHHLSLLIKLYQRKEFDMVYEKPLKLGFSNFSQNFPGYRAHSCRLPVCRYRAKQVILRNDGRLLAP